MIKAIAFDYGGVIEEVEGGLTQRISEYLKITKKDWDKVYYTLNHLCNTGKKSYEEVFALTAKELGASDDQMSHINNMQRENIKTRKINLELVEIIKDFRKNNYKIGLLSNNYIELRQELAEQGLIDLFDAVVVSSEVGYQKTATRDF